jgi:hypothetical protein
MKMIKRTLIAIAVVALLATSAPAAITEHYFGGPGISDTMGVKVDGKETVDFRWPYTISYKALTVCSIPIKMKVGMYVQIKDCGLKKIVLGQVNCSDIGKGSGDYPCYLGCVEFEVRANFNVKMGQALTQSGDMITAGGGDWSCYYDGGDTVPNDGNWHNMKVCVKAWKTAIYKALPGDEVDVGSIAITVKPNT